MPDIRKFRTIEEFLFEQFKDPENIEQFINAALQEYQEDDDYEAFLNAIKKVIQYKGTITQFSKDSKINRTHLYKILNNEIQPQFNTVITLLKNLGYNIQVKKVS